MRSILLSALLLSLAACSTEAPKEAPTTTEAPKPAPIAISNTVDPVCGMNITATEASAYADHDGKKLGFCSEGCAEEFKKDPAQYVAKLK